jgi:signal transduction histidine kinase
LNVMQHSQATEVVILIEGTEEAIILSVIDNGKGFDFATPQSHGMRNMQGRADYINGELTIDSKVDQGTTVRISVRAVEKV